MPDDDLKTNDKVSQHSDTSQREHTEVVAAQSQVGAETLQFRPVSIEVIGRYDYKVLFKQTDHVREIIFKVDSEFPGVQTPTEFYEELGGPTQETRPLVECILWLDEARIERSEFKDITLLEKKNEALKTNRIMTFEPLSIVALDELSYSVNLLVKDHRENFVFTVCEQSSVKPSTEFGLLMDNDLTEAKPLINAVLEFHKARRSD